MIDNYPDKAIIDQFLNRYENIKSMVRYQITIYDFISLINFKKVTLISKDEILDYFELIKDNAARVCHTKEFVKFLIFRGLLNSEILNDGKFVEKVYNFRPLQKDPRRTSIKYPINTIIQIDNDIKTNYKYLPKENKWDYERSIKISLFWELLFDAGVQVGDIKSLKTRYLLDKNEYLMSREKNAIAEAYFNQEPNTVKNIINDYYYILFLDLDKKKAKDGFSSLSCLEHYNNDELLVYGLLAQDIIAARNKFYIKCPNCGSENKSLPKNWVFVKFKETDEKFLVCSTCKGSDLNVS